MREIPRALALAAVMLLTVLVWPSPASANHDDIERCNSWIQEFINDPDVLGENSNTGGPVDECVPENVDLEEAFQVEETTPWTCVHFCEPEKVEAVSLVGDPVISGIKAYLIWCDLQLPTGHTIITAQVNTVDDCLQGTRNCQLNCFAILDSDIVGEGELEVPLPPICEADAAAYVFGVRVFEGPVLAPC